MNENIVWLLKSVLIVSQSQRMEQLIPLISFPCITSGLWTVVENSELHLLKYCAAVQFWATFLKYIWVFGFYFMLFMLNFFTTFIWELYSLATMQILISNRVQNVTLYDVGYYYRLSNSASATSLPSATLTERAHESIIMI